jgi:hypothetical protein
MAQFLGLGNFITKIIITLLKYAYRLFNYVYRRILKGLGQFIEISFEYFVKLIYQVFKFVVR